MDARPLDHPTARQRGIGRYVTGMLRGLHEIGAPVVALCGSPLEAQLLDEAIPGLEHRLWSPQVLRASAEPGTWYLATQLMLHPIPLDPIPRCVTESGLPVAAVMYDVIPYRFPERYQVDPPAQRQAQLRAILARTVDTMLAISKFAADTAAQELAFPTARMAVIGAGVEAQFTPPRQPDGTRSGLPGRGLRRYLVSVTGTDPRKNTEGLLRAWGAVGSTTRASHDLVVVGTHTPAVLREWERVAGDAGVSDSVVFTGSVDDTELVDLLQHARLAVVPSLEEGFGLPVLEAAACGVPVICSAVSSLPEVLDEPAATFDPHDTASIADAIERGLADGDHRTRLMAAGERAVERWTWAGVATRALEALEQDRPRWVRSLQRPPERLAIAGAFDGDPDADVAAALLHAIRAEAVGVEVVALADTAATPVPAFHAAPGPCAPVRAVGRFVKAWDFDHIVALTWSGGCAIGALVADHPCHIWVGDSVAGRDGARIDARAANPRSFIVGHAAMVEWLRTVAPPAPVLVIGPTGAEMSFDDVARALIAWLEEVDTLEPTTVRHAFGPLASPPLHG